MTHAEQVDWMRVKLPGAVTLAHDSEPIPTITKVSVLVVENVKEQPSMELQSLKSYLGMLGLVSKGAVVFAPFTLYPIMSRTRDCGGPGYGRYCVIFPYHGAVAALGIGGVGVSLLK